MTELIDSPSHPSPPESPEVKVLSSAGALLRQARERSGVQLSVLSHALKVPIQTLRAMEEDDHSHLSGPVFVRALASSLCRQLRIDPQPVLALLPQTTQHLQWSDSSHPTAPSTFSDRIHAWHVPGGVKFWLATVMVLLLIALVIGLPDWPSHSSVPVATPETTSQSSAPQAEPLPASASAPLVVLMPSESSADSVSPNSTSDAKPVNSPSLPVAAPSTSGALEVTFKGKGEDAWVEVKDVGGAVIFSKLVHFGDTYVVKGVPVLTVVVGLADSVDVLVRGQALDLSPFSRGAVARFEVK